MYEEVLLVIVGALMIIEGAFIFIAPKKTKLLINRLVKKHGSLKFLGFLEFLIGLALLFLALY